VTWKVTEASGGTITSDGLYSAPGHPGTFHVVATSVTDPSISATATISVTASGFRLAGTLLTSRGGHTATLLADGKVLVAGGADATAHEFASAELFDPNSGSFTATGSMSVARSGHAATLLPNGKVLITGGDDSGGNALASAEVFDPSTGTFSSTGNMNTARAGHIAILRSDGKILVAGGSDSSPAELYDSASGTFANIGNPVEFDRESTQTPLANGKILVAGGVHGIAALQSANLLDPGTTAFTPTGNMSSTRAQHTATILADGRVMIVGGWNGHAPDASDDPPWDPLNADIYDPSSGSFSPPAGRMSITRIGHTATRLASGSVLVAGGIPSMPNLHDPPGYPPSTELFDPNSGNFSATGGLIIERSGHTATLLNDGEVVVIGGFDIKGSLVAAAELYR
jgi:WD40 repeat protein